MSGSFWRPSLVQLGLPGFLMNYGGMGKQDFLEGYQSKLKKQRKPLTLDAGCCGWPCMTQALLTTGCLWGRYGYKKVMGIPLYGFMSRDHAEIRRLWAFPCKAEKRQFECRRMYILSAFCFCWFSLSLSLSLCLSLSLSLALSLFLFLSLSQEDVRT